MANRAVASVDITRHASCEAVAWTSWCTLASERGCSPRARSADGPPSMIAGMPALGCWGLPQCRRYPRAPSLSHVFGVLFAHLLLSSVVVSSLAPPSPQHSWPSSLLRTSSCSSLVSSPTLFALSSSFSPSSLPSLSRRRRRLVVAPSSTISPGASGGSEGLGVPQPLGSFATPRGPLDTLVSRLGKRRGWARRHDAPLFMGPASKRRASQAARSRGDGRDEPRRRARMHLHMSSQLHLYLQMRMHLRIHAHVHVHVLVDFGRG